MDIGQKHVADKDKGYMKGPTMLCRQLFILTPGTTGFERVRNVLFG